MAAKTFNVGIVGYAFSAKVFHIPLIQAVPSLKIYAFVQRHPQPSDDAAKDFPEAKIYRSAEDLVKDKNVDLVVVTTPPSSHFELAQLALKNGKHVVVEKPFVPTYHEAQELISLAAKHKCLLAVYQNRRWDSDFLTVADLVEKGTLGRITEFETHFDRHRPEASTGWKATPGPGAGVVYDLGTHLMDQVVTLFGFPKKVTGFVGTQRENNTTGFEDSCTILLHYDGMLATVKAAIISPEENQLRFWVRGSKGSFKKYHLDCQEDQLKAGKKPSDSGFGVEADDKHGVLSLVDSSSISSKRHPTIKPTTWSAYYEKMAEALAGKGEVPVKAEDGARLIRLVELARQSSREGRTLDF